MGISQLDAYNRVLVALGERRIASTSEQREPRRVLDDLYTDCIQYCLEQGMWNFAMVSTALSAASSGAFMSYTTQFTKPSDLIHLFMASISSTFDPPLTGDYIDQGGSWYSNATSALYVRYTSNGASFGANTALWTQSFGTYLVHTIAHWAALRITGSPAIEAAMERKAARYLLSALAIDSVPQLPGMRPFNSEARAKIVEGFQPQPIDVAPFHAPLAQPTPAQGQGGGG